MNTLFDLPDPRAKHPAKYTDVLLTTFVKFLRDSKRVLDPFGGTGKIFLINKWLPDLEIFAVEIEAEWARIHPKTINGNALFLPFKDESFDSICSSPTYGNAMGKILLPSDKWTKTHKPVTYSAVLGRRLHNQNSGRLLWGDKYREFHREAWREAARVLKRRGSFVLNIKNHILDGEEQKVKEWHIETLESIGFSAMEEVKLKAPSMRYGRSREKRIEFESVIKLVLR